MTRYNQIFLKEKPLIILATWAQIFVLKWMLIVSDFRQYVYFNAHYFFIVTFQHR